VGSTGSLTTDDKFAGAVAVGILVVFAPLNAHVVGVYDTETQSFDGSISAGLTMDGKFFGAAAVGNLVVFAPRSADVVGFFLGALPPNIK
jgi:hypothetical protein